MEKRFQQLQRQLAAHIRDPEHNPAPEGVEDARLKVYKRLFFNNIVGFTSSAFPALSELLGEERWEVMNRAFYSQYRCHSPYFNEISAEFLKFLSDYDDGSDEGSFVYDLAHFERMKAELSVSCERADAQGLAPDGDLLDNIPVLSPLTRLGVYRWPVHKAAEDGRFPDAPEPTRLLVWRIPDSNRTRCMTCNEVGAALVESLRERDDSGAAHIRAALEHAGCAVNDAAVAGGRAMLEDLREKEIIVGVRRRS